MKLKQHFSFCLCLFDANSKQIIVFPLNWVWVRNYWAEQKILANISIPFASSLVDIKEITTDTGQNIMNHSQKIGLFSLCTDNDVPVTICSFRGTLSQLNRTSNIYQIVRQCGLSISHLIGLLATGFRSLQFCLDLINERMLFYWLILLFSDNQIQLSTLWRTIGTLRFIQTSSCPVFDWEEFSIFDKEILLPFKIITRNKRQIKTQFSNFQDSNKKAFFKEDPCLSRTERCLV